MIRSSLVALCALVVLKSSDHTYAPLAAFHIAHNNHYALSWYYKAPQWFNHSNVSLPALRTLASAGIAKAQLQVAGALIEQTHFHSAQVYWRSALKNTSTHHYEALWQPIVAALIQQQNWAQVSAIAAHIPLSKKAHNQLLLAQQAPANQLDEGIARSLGFTTALDKVRPQNCAFNVLLLSSHQQGLNTLNAFKTRYNTQPEPAKGLMCLSQPVYVGPVLQCTQNKAQQTRCDLTVFAQQAYKLPAGFDFLVLMGQSGQANVQAGVMQLSDKAPYHVFVHELAHFANFVDEYPAPEAQKAQCEQTGRLYANLYVGDSPPKGWYHNRYCTNQRGYKPTNKITFMAHSEFDITWEYRQLWQQQLVEKSSHLRRMSEHLYRLNPTAHWLNYTQALKGSVSDNANQ